MTGKMLKKLRAVGPFHSIRGYIILLTIGTHCSICLTLQPVVPADILRSQGKADCYGLGNRFEPADERGNTFTALIRKGFLRDL
jgi:hypothetical protein